MLLGTALPSEAVRRLARTFLPLALLLTMTICAHAQIGSQLRVLYPNGGERLVADSLVNIRWIAFGVSGQLTVDYSLDSGQNWSTIATVPAKNGVDTLPWTVPSQVTTTALVRVTAIDTPMTDRSNAVFSISLMPVPVLRVRYPNGGETFAFDSTARIRWSAENVAGQVVVDYSIDSGRTWTNITTVPARAGLDTLPWKIPHDSTRRAMVRVRTPDDATHDESDRTFTIRATLNSTIKVLYPNGGEVFAPDSVTRVRWQAQDVTGQISIDFSPNGGTTWTRVGMRGARDGVDSLAWTVPDTATTTALFRVRLLGSGGGLNDVSDTTFTIGKKDDPPLPDPSITILYPNGGERLRAGSPVYIRWTDTAVTGQLVVGYSDDNGATWQQIAIVPAHEGADSVEWSVPDVPTDSALVAVATLDGVIRGLSGGTFTIVRVAGVREDLTVSRGLRLEGCFPNPASASATIRWTQEHAGPTTITFYDNNGARRATIDAGWHEPGAQQSELDLRAVPAGSYRYELRGDGATAAGQITVVR